MYALYSAMLALVLVLGSPWWLLKMLRHGKYRAGLKERFGRVPSRLHPGDAAGCIWVHAVSVGEVLAVAGLIGQLRHRFPTRRVLVSTTTATGQALARKRFGDENVFYFPLDFAFAIRAHLRALRPALVVVAETEFWPNFLRLAKASGATIAVVNARISDRSLPRYTRFRGLLRNVLVHVDLFLAQSKEDERRLFAIGAIPERVRVSGNLKFDVHPPAEFPAIVGQLRAALIVGGAGPVVVAGSTVEGEEEQVVAAFAAATRHTSNSVLVLAPRHPERFSAVADLLDKTDFRVTRRSQWKPDKSISSGIFLLDTIGELGVVYSLADVAFVGGSLAPRGGHNILEPAMYGVPTIVGPHTENFRDIIQLFRRADAVIVVRDSNELQAALIDLLEHPQKRRELGDRAADLVRSQSGATERTLAEVERLLAGSPRHEVPQP